MTIETAQKEVERFKVGFASDHTGATHKYHILTETNNDKYVVRPFIVMRSVWNEKYLATTPFEMKDKSEVTDIHYETLEGERI